MIIEGILILTSGKQFENIEFPQTYLHLMTDNYGPALRLFFGLIFVLYFFQLTFNVEKNSFL